MLLRDSDGGPFGRIMFFNDSVFRSYRVVIADPLIIL
jgi:hypothetical protein